MVNITIDFKNNKVYLRRPRLIKGGVYKLSIDPADKLIRVIQPEVLQLLTKAIDAFSKCNTIYTESEYIQYDYNRGKQSGFLKLIRNGNEIIHLSIFTGTNSTPHLTFNDIEGITIHLYLANLELLSFNNNISTTYPAILQKYKGLKECKSTFTFFHDLLNLINVKLDYIKDRDPINQYHTQLKYYIDAFMNILANPGPATIYKGKFPENTQTTLTNMMTDDEFTEEILNYEINKKITSIKAFVESNNGRLTAFNSLINEFIKANSLDKVIKAIKTYEFYKSFPITDNATSAFSYTEVFQTTADIDAFIAEFEKNKKFVESVEEKLSSKIKSNFDEIVKYIANINLLFNDKTHDNLTMILDIQTKRIELTRGKANRLEKFMQRCRDTNDDLHNLLNTNTIAIDKIKELATSKKKKEKEEEESTVQTGQTTGAKTTGAKTTGGKTTGAKTTGAKTTGAKTTGGKTKPTPNTKTKPTPNTKTKPTPNTKTKPTPNTKTKPTPNTNKRTNSTTLKKK